VVQNITARVVVLVVATTEVEVEVEVEVVGETVDDPQAARVKATTARLTAAASLLIADPLFVFDRSSGGLEKAVGNDSPNAHSSHQRSNTPNTGRFAA